jgi:hypothetical protein
MSTKRIQVPKANKGKGYVAVWQRGKLGWWLPNHLYGGSGAADPVNHYAVKAGYLEGERVYLCEITIKPILDKNGRPKTKLIKK